MQSKAQWKKERKREKKQERPEDSDGDEDFLSAFGSMTGRLSTMLGINVSGLLPRLLHSFCCFGAMVNYFLPPTWRQARI